MLICRSNIHKIKNGIRRCGQKSKNRTSKWKNLLKSRKYEKQKCRIDEKFSEALLQLLVLFQSFRINHRLKRYTKILQGFYWRTAIPYYF